jgi:hypothetical protein
VGELIRLDDWRQAREGVLSSPALRRLDQLVRRLDPAITQVAMPDGTVDPRIETELLAITGAVSMGLTSEAVERAERLAVLLEHPSARRR